MYLHQAIRAAVEAGLAEVHTVLPAKVEAFDVGEQTVTCRPQVPRVFRDGTSLALPALQGVPVAFPGAKDAAMRWPLAEGSFGLVIFSEAALDRYLQHGDGGSPGDVRRHALQDAIFVPSPAYPDGQASTGWDGASLQIEYGKAKLKLTADGKVAVGSSEAEFLDLVDQLLGMLLTATTPTMIGPQPLSIVPGGQLLDLRNKLTLIRGSL